MPGPESSSHEPEAPVTPLSTLEAADLEAATEEALDDVTAILDEAEAQAPAPADVDKSAPAPAPVAGKDYKKKVLAMMNDGSIFDLFEDFAEILGNKITGASGITEEQWDSVAQGAGLGVYGQKGADPESAKLTPKERKKVAQARVDIDSATLSKGEILPKDKWLWPKASHFTFGAGTETRITSLPQANRKVNRNGVKLNRPHTGLDLSAPTGTPLIMSRNAVVTDAGFDSGSGNYVKVTFDDGTSASFSHLSEIIATRGQKIEPGQVFGKVGSTGVSTGPHLHLNVYDRGGKLADPFPFLGETSVKAPEGYAYYRDYDDSHEHVADEGHEDHDHGEDETSEAA